MDNEEVAFEEASKHRAVVMQEVGFKVADTPEGITLAMSACDETQDCRHISFIPRGMIREVREFRAIQKSRSTALSGK